MTYLAYLPDDSLSVVLLMNTEGPVSHVRLVEQAESLRWVRGRTFTNGASRFTFVSRAGKAPVVWADLTYVVARWKRSTAGGARARPDAAPAR